MGVLDFHADENATIEKMKEEISRAIKNDLAEVIILGCTMQFGFYKEMQEEFKVPVIDSMIAALKHAEYLIEMKEKTGVFFSRRGLYESPDAEEMRMWNMEEDFGLDGLLYNDSNLW